MEKILSQLFAWQDAGYRLFQSKLMPNVDPETIIGVRTPILRKYAKELSRDPDIRVFLSELPHRYYDEMNLHGFILSEGKDYAQVVRDIDAYLPHVNNWATCDLVSPKVFKKHRIELREDIERWLSSGETFTVRFGIEMIQSHYLDEDFDPGFLARVSRIRSSEYYVNMMIAWYFATALSKQWDSTVPYLETQALDDWTHNKAIQKALESYRITPEQKEYLRGLKINSGKS